MLTFVSLFSILGVLALIKLQLKFQLNVDHTACTILLYLVVFQLIRYDSANVFYSTFYFFHKTRV